MLKKLPYMIYARIFIYINIIKYRFRKRKNGLERERVFILSAGGIGDAIVSAQAYKALIEYYISLNKQVYVMANSALQSGLKMAFDREIEEVHWIASDFLNCKLDHNVLTAFKQQMEDLSRLNVEHIIIMSNILSQYVRACYVAACLKAKYVNAGLYDQYPQRMLNRIKLMFFENVFYKTSRLPSGLNESVFWRRFINEIDRIDYKISMPYIKKQSDYKYTARGGGYATVAVDSSSVRRRWPAQRFIELTKGILDKTDCDIVITGNNVAEEAIDEYVAAFRGCSRVSIQIKKLKLSEWVELIRGARFFIGVDSGGVHVAAAVGTQAFCLTGAWDGHRFYPYPLEERTNKHSIEPICICRNDVDRNELPCAGCCSKGGYGYGNPKCRARCKRGETCQCLLKIMPDDVLTALHDAHALDPVNCE